MKTLNSIVPRLSDDVLPMNSELALKRMWEQILEVDQIDVNDSFFELGGTSLIAARLFAEIERTMNVRLQFSTLVREPTIKQLALVVEYANLLACRTIVSALTPASADAEFEPLFCVSAPGVNALGYKALGCALGSSHPLYVLQSNYRSPVLKPYTRIELRELASDYIRSMKSVSEDGPYNIAGMCTGLHIGFEMARQLTASGDSVALLVSFNTWPEENTRSRYKWLLEQARLALSGPKKTNRARRVLNATRIVGCGLKDWACSLVGAQDPESLEAQYWPGRKYVPDLYDGDLIVLRVREQLRDRIASTTLGWSARVRGEVTVYDIGGENITMFREPHVNSLANLLTRLMQSQPDP